MPQTTVLSSECVKSFAAKVGFTACGICPAAPVEQQVADLMDRYVGEGRNADMDYLARNRELRFNPSKLVPGTKSSCILRLPTHGISAFIAAGDSVYTYNSDELFTNRKEVAVAQPAKRSTSSGSRSKAKTITIRSGDTLSTIAKRYGTTVSKLKRLNGIKGTSIRAGKRLRVR